MKTKIERLEEALNLISGDGGCGCHPVCQCDHEGQLRIWKENARQIARDATNPPPPEMETLEIKRSMCGNCERIHKIDQEAVNCCEETATGKTPIIRLTGTYQRPKPRQVERSVSVGVIVTRSSRDWRPGAVLTEDGHPFVIFEHAPECHGKTGTLNFTWLEDEVPA